MQSFCQNAEITDVLKTKEILVNLGSKPKDIFTSKIMGAHPGGTAALGEIVGTNFMTMIPNLYVCDGSILPKAPGLPPIVTLCALGKKLGKTFNLNN